MHDWILQSYLPPNQTNGEQTPRKSNMQLIKVEIRDSYTHPDALHTRPSPVTDALHMDLYWKLFDGNSQLLYQFMNIPFALLFYVSTRQGRLSVVNRHVCLTLGGFILAVVLMGPYSSLLFFSSVLSLLLIHLLDPTQVHQWTLLLQMCWQTLWHLYIQYLQYWLQEAPDSRLLWATSALMLMTQRVSSLSLDLQEGKVNSRFQRSQCHKSETFISFLSYLFGFPSLLGGPLCSFNTFAESVRLMSSAPPLPSCLANVTFKLLQVLFLVLMKCSVTVLLTSYTVNVNYGIFQDIFVIWISALLLKMNYYTHWKVSECVSNAAGMGLHGYSHTKASWDGLSDGSLWVTEMSSRPSAFARSWNRTTAVWLRRIVFRRYNRSLLMTFGFSAWWHGLHPGQIVGFLIWATTVQGDYKLHHFLRPKLTSLWHKRLYTSLSWTFTQLTTACVVVCVELQSLASVKLLCSSYIVVFPVLSVLVITVL